MLKRTSKFETVWNRNQLNFPEGIRLKFLHCPLIPRHSVMLGHLRFTETTLRFSVACEVAQRRLIKIYVLLEENAAPPLPGGRGTAGFSAMETVFSSENLYNYFH